MPGRYEFSLPEAPIRDGWFRLGTLDVTTTAIYTGLAMISMLLYAISPEFVFKGAFVSDLVRSGEVWRLVTYPLVNPPTGDSLAFIWIIISLVFFWWVGHQVEEAVGRKPYTVLLLTMTVLPALLATALNARNAADIAGRFTAYSYALTSLSLALFVVVAMEHPQRPAFFRLPIWVFAAGYVAIDVLQLLGDRRWAQLVLDLSITVVAVIGARQLGMLTDYAFIPNVLKVAPANRSPYGELASNPTRVKKSRRRGKAAQGKGGAGTVVSGPWGQGSSGGPTPLEQAELDVLLDKISADGIDSLTKHEKDRLNALSKRMRGS